MSDPINVEFEEEDIRGILAVGGLLLLAATVFISFFSIAKGYMTVEEAMTIIAAILGIVATVNGYYFGAKSG